MSAPILGFGGASMGSRKSQAESLAALRRAYDAGVRWFDVAPSYGDGDAERVLGKFLAEKHPGVAICTKVGILPGEISLAKRLARPVLRTVLTMAPGLRNAIKRNRPPAAKQLLTPELIRTSIDQSLVRLGVERVDVLALHDATSDEVVREDNLRALEDVATAGKASAIGIASTAAAASAGVAASPLYRFVQVANNPFDPGAAEVAAALPADWNGRLSTHSVYGAGGMAKTIATRIEADEALRAMMADAGYPSEPGDAAIAFLADFAFTAPRVDTVLVSMFSASHLASNLARHAAAADRDRGAIDRIAARLRGAA